MRLKALLLLVLIVIGCSAGAYSLYDWFWGADAYYRAAREAADRRDFALAAADLGTCLKERPNHFAARLLAARVARLSLPPAPPGATEAQRQSLVVGTSRPGVSYDEVEGHLRECRRLGGEPEMVFLEQLLTRAQRGDLEGPVEPGPGGRGVAAVLRTLTDEAAVAPVVLEALARGYLQANRLPEADHVLDEWLGLRPGDVQARLWRGWVRERRADWGGAEKDYAAALQKDPGHFGARLRLAEALLGGKKVAEASEQLETLRGQDRPGAEGSAVLLVLARCRREEGKPAEAGKLLDDLLARDPDNAAALLDRGGLALAENRPEAAQHWLVRAVAAAPDDVSALEALAGCYQRLGREKEAHAAREKAARLTEERKKLAARS